MYSIHGYQPSLNSLLSSIVGVRFSAMRPTTIVGHPGERWSSFVSKRAVGLRMGVISSCAAVGTDVVSQDRTLQNSSVVPQSVPQVKRPRFTVSAAEAA